ncbi:hypothetical protein NKI12_31780 [Mesorhizobium australicum]|uniref:Uncharacterized protein n=1 Tax=Mesorhizobium australicum TaxID=536018 RepID=A0ACC6T8W0_9HYPH
MSKFHIADEAIGAMWDGVARELDVLAPSERAAQAFLKTARHRFLGMLRDFPHDVFECVTAPAPGTRNHVMVLRIRGSFKVDLARAAKKFHGTASH